MLCTANQCRSPMAEVLLRDRLSRAGVDAVVQSAGDLPGGVHASPGAVKAMAELGLDLSDHISRAVTAELVGRADLVLAMGRRHLRSAVAAARSAWPRTFTVKELARRASAHGPRRAEESFAAWLAAVHEGRVAHALLGDDPRDDVADPIGGPDHLYAATAAELAGLLDRIVALAFPTASSTRETA